MKTILDEHGFAVKDGYIHVYNTNPLTSEFTGETDEYLTLGVGVPANSYIDAPPMTKSGYAVCRTPDGWEYVEDWRNVEAYLTETREPMLITVLGPLSPNLTTLKPETAFDFWDGDKWITDVGAIRQAEIIEAESRKSQLLSETDKVIERLKSAVDLDMATKDEIELYTEWRKYSVLLSRVDTSKSIDIDWPKQPDKY